MFRSCNQDLVAASAAITLWWRRCSQLFLAVAVIFATRASRLMSGGVNPAITGKNVVSVGRMHPVMIRIESFSATSSFLVWAYVSTSANEKAGQSGRKSVKSGSSYVFPTARGRNGVHRI